MKAKEWVKGALFLGISLLAVPSVNGAPKGDVAYDAGICMECHKAEPQTLMGEWEHVAMKSATIQLKVDGRHEIVTFDKERIRIANSAVKGDKEKKLRAIKEGDEVAVSITDRDGVMEASEIAIKPPVKLTAAERIKPAELEKLVARGTEKGGYLLVDSRPAGDFEKGSIPTAVNIPFNEIDAKVAMLSKDRKLLIVFYGGNDRSRMGTVSMKKAKALGYRNVKVLAEGLEGWLANESGSISADSLADAYRDVPYVLLDTRPADVAAKGFIKGATAFAGADAKALKSLPKTELKAPVIVYDDDGKGSAPKVAADIVKSGQGNVMVLAGGIVKAKAAGLPIESGTPGSRIAYAAKAKAGSFPMDDFIKLVEAIPADTVLMDVRNADELKNGSIKGAMNIPVQDLFRRAREVPRDKRVIAYCNSGARAEMAYHILKEKGFSNIHFLKAHVDYDDGEPDIY